MKKARDIEFERLVMENLSLHSRVDFLESRLENSVPRELYDAKVAECESRKAEAKAKDILHEEEMDALKNAHKREIAEKDKETAALNLNLRMRLKRRKLSCLKIWTARKQWSSGGLLTLQQVPKN